MEKILLLNGPNLNMLGKRNPQVYGTVNFETIEKRVRNFLVEHDISLESFQSNHEGELIDALQEADDNYSGIIFNPSLFAYKHCIKRCSGSHFDTCRRSAYFQYLC